MQALLIQIDDVRKVSIPRTESILYRIVSPET